MRPSVSPIVWPIVSPIDLPILPSATPHPTETAVGPTEQELSDQYWSSITHFGAYGFEYDSLAEMVRDSHLIVRGRVVELKPGETQPFEPGGPNGAIPVIFGIIAVDEVLKGVPEMKSEGRIMVARLGWSATSDSFLPKDEVVLFLKNYAQMRVEEGVKPSADSDDRFYYVRPNGYQCIFRNIDGRVSLIQPREDWEQVFAEWFPFELEGADFEDMVGEVRSLAD